MIDNRFKDGKERSDLIFGLTRTSRPELRYCFKRGSWHASL